MKITRYIISMLLLAGLFSCEKDSNLDFFDLQYPREAPWPSVSDFEKAVVGSYWLLSGDNSGRTPWANQRLILDALADGVYFDANFGGDGAVQDLYNRESDVSNNYPDGLFKCAYAAIGTATDAINFLETDPYRFDINKDQVPRQEGEIRFCRAFSWWMLSTVYLPAYEEGIRNQASVLPSLTEIPGGFEDAVNNPSATVGEIYDIMESDLKRAIAILPEKFEQGTYPDAYQYGRVNKYGAMALLMRVYFQMNKFDLVEAYCDSIIDFSETTGHYSLDENPIDAFNKAYGFEGNGTEVIWYYLQYEGDGVGSWKNQWVLERMSRSRRYGDNHAGRTLSCSDYFLENVGWQDPATKEPTPEALMDKRFDTLYHRYLASEDMPADYADPNDGVYETQFATDRAYIWGDKYYRDPNNRIGTNVPIFRLPEIYLTRAIVRFNSGNTNGALEDLNKVRVRNGLTELSSVTANDIHNERWKELNFEGDRLTYLRALHIDVPNGDRGTGSVTWNDQVWQWAIMEREAELNTAY